VRLIDDRLILTPTDLADSLACRHKTTLELAAARGERERPQYSDPLADVLRQRGMEHEQRYVESLCARGLGITNLKGERDVQRTIDAMRSGVDVIVQAPLGNGGWFGFADVLVKVPGASDLGDWHYEAHDTKLARETRAGAILQLCVYTELLGELQGRTPDHFHIVTPAASHTYRFTDVAAYYRLVQRNLRRAGASAPPPPTYPDPTEHCGFCRWWEVCNAQRRKDDHLQFVANLGRVHKRELETQSITTLEQLAVWEVPKTFRPKHGSRETFERLQDQAALQKQQRDIKQPQYKLLPIEPHVADDGTALPLRGLKRLPAPSPGDLYLDLEGDPFGRKVLATESGEGSREYLFGLGWVDQGGEFQFKGWWAFDDAEERKAFEEVMDWITRVVAGRPDAHVYHYAPYEPSAFKRLSGRYATREAELDVMLRAGTFVDLYAVVRESVRAGVETYSIKSMEPFYNFTRDIDLRKAGHERQTIEIALESGDVRAIPDEVRAAVEGYNRDDVRSTYELQRWLESIRPADLPRPVIEAGDPPEALGEREARVLALRDRLLSSEQPSSEQPGFSPADSVGLKPDASETTRLIAYLLDWHRRENKAEWWEYFRLKDLDADALLDERKAVSKLAFAESLGPVISEKTGKPTKSVIDRYRFPLQDCDVKAGDKLNLSDGKGWGEVVAVDRVAHTIDVKVGPGRAGERPISAFAHDVVNAPKIEDALYAIGTEMADGHPAPLAQALLERHPGLVTAIQGPPGTGKTYQGSVMICELVAAGKSVGVTAHSHAVIANLLKAVRKEAARRGLTVPMLHVKNEDEYGDDNPKVVGGTAWHWCSDDAVPVDVLFVDEAGQMSLANTLACTRMATSMVLLGDPQQLEQPTKGVHPDGTGVSALQHMLGEHKTMPEERGEFLDVTWRLPPAISAFTSEVFYEGRLTSKPNLERQVLRGAPGFEGAGLRIVPVDHDGNRNASDEEVTEIVRIVDALLAPGSEWVDEDGEAHQITASDIRIVAPYNAQVSRISEALSDVGRGLQPRRELSDVGRGLQPRHEIPVGTVDKFQGQEAPVVIYSMATSRPEDAPRGLGFLYSLNRFNVATSRARCLCILVANPRLFEPDCQTPAQMQLANALCRYVELSR
jgi:predicted RecB family nuclease